MGNPNVAQTHKTADLTELVGTQLFKQVSMAQVAGLLRYCPTLTLTDGDRLIVPGQTIDKIHLLLQGHLQVFEGVPNGKPVGQIRQGECVGLSSFVDRQPCHVSIISDGISRLLVLDEERLTALTNTPTAISRNLLFLLMNYLRHKAARASETPAPPAPPATSTNTYNHIDAATGLHNQGWLDETLDRLIMRAATDSAPLSLLAVDLLELPGLTEEYGQELLDMSLREIANTLGTSIRPTDLIARHTTGRFIVMLPGANQEHTEMVATRIQEIVNSTEIVIPGVCVLPPMKIVVGGTRMSAFVSGRKLVEDAFAALERNRANMLAAMTESATETTETAEVTPEPESSDTDVYDFPALEPQSIEMIAEASPATPDNTALEMAAENPLEEACIGNTSPVSVPVIQLENGLTDEAAVEREVPPDESSHTAT